MEIIRTSMLTGKTHTMDIPVTEAQLDLYYSYKVLLQDAFPNLTPSQREFIKTGITDEEWDATINLPNDVDEGSR